MHRYGKGAPGLAALVLLLFAGAKAQVAGGPGAGGPSAGEVAARIDHHYNSLRSVTVSFTESYEGLGIKRTETGTLDLKKPGRMRWSYSRPAGKLFVMDGKFAYFYTPGDVQAEQIAAKQLDDLRSPLRFLLGHTQVMKELADVRLEGGAPSGAAYRLTGVPRGENQRVKQIAIDAAGDGAIRGMTIEEVDGARTTFEFSSEVANPALPDSNFEFHAPAGVAIVKGVPPA